MSRRASWSRWQQRLDTVNRRWAPWFSLATGTVAAVLWREGIDHVRAAVVLASVAGLVTLLLLFPPWLRDDEAPTWQRRLHDAASWCAVNLAQSALWFVLPFYVLSTTWLSRNAPFTVLLVALCVLACFEAFLRERVLRAGAATLAFVMPVQLAALQLFLPVLTGIAPRHTIFLSGAIVGLTGALLLVPPPKRRAGAALAWMAVAIFLGVAGARVVLPLLAPAPMRLVSAQFALGRDGLEPRGPLTVLPAGGDPTYVFVAVEAPAGLRETVRLDIEGADTRTTRPLEVFGGRDGGYRLWTPLFAGEPGPLHATVRTEGGQVVGTASIRAVAAADVASPLPAPAAADAPTPRPAAAADVATPAAAAAGPPSRPRTPRAAAGG